MDKETGVVSLITVPLRKGGTIIFVDSSVLVFLCVMRTVRSRLLLCVSGVLQEEKRGDWECLA